MNAEFEKRVAASHRAVTREQRRIKNDLEVMLALFDLFTRTRAVRRSIIEQGQDDSRPDFGRAHE